MMMRVFGKLLEGVLGPVRDGVNIAVLVAHDSVMKELKEQREKIEAAMARPQILLLDY